MRCPAHGGNCRHAAIAWHGSCMHVSEASVFSFPYAFDELHHHEVEFNSYSSAGELALRLSDRLKALQFAGWAGCLASERASSTLPQQDAKAVCESCGRCCIQILFRSRRYALSETAPKMTRRQLGKEKFDMMLGLAELSIGSLAHCCLQGVLSMKTAWTKMTHLQRKALKWTGLKRILTALHYLPGGSAWERG